MTRWFVTRHPGAVAWARQHGLAVDNVVAELDLKAVRAGDQVLGTLPLHVAAAVCARGARFWSLAMDLPLDWRGRELTPADLDRFGARLEEYRVERVPGPWPLPDRA